MNASLSPAIALALTASIAGPPRSASAEATVLFDFEDGAVGDFAEEAEVPGEVVVPGLNGSKFAYQARTTASDENSFAVLGAVDLDERLDDGLTLDTVNVTLRVTASFTGTRVAYNSLVVRANVYDQDGTPRNRFLTVPGLINFSSKDTGELTGTFVLDSVLEAVLDPEADSVDLRFIANSGAGNAGVYTIDDIQIESVLPEPG